MAANDAGVRKAIASSGGRIRMETADPDEMLAQRRRAAAALHHPITLARRIAKAWSQLSPADRDKVRAILADLPAEAPRPRQAKAARGLRVPD